MGYRQFPCRGSQVEIDRDVADPGEAVGEACLNGRCSAWLQIFAALLPGQGSWSKAARIGNNWSTGRKGAGPAGRGRLPSGGTTAIWPMLQVNGSMMMSGITVAARDISGPVPIGHVSSSRASRGMSGNVISGDSWSGVKAKRMSLTGKSGVP